MPYQRHDKDGNPVTAIASYVRHDKDGNPVALKKYQRHDKDGNAMGPRAEYQRRDSSNTLDSPQPESRTFVDAFGNTYKDYSADYEARDVDGNLLNDFESVFNRSKLDLDFAGNKSLIDAVSGNYLIDHVRDTSPNRSTYVDAAGLIKKSVTNLVKYSEDLQTGWVDTNVTVTPNAIQAPDGSLTADKIEGVNNSSSIVYQAFTAALTSTTYTFSFWIKSVDGSSGTWGINFYNTTTHNRTAVPVTGEWTRVSAQFSNMNPSTNNIYIADNREGLGDLTEAYVWGLQLEEASTVGEYVKTTATRSSAPRFDHDPATGQSLGLLVEESRINYVTQSESFSTWTVQYLTQSTASDVVAPDGTTGSVQLFTEDETTNTHRLYIAPSAGGAANHANTIFVKVASGTRRLYLSSDNSSGIRRTLIFDLANETYDNTSAGIEDWSNITIEAYPNGWYRVGAVIEDTGGSTLQIWGTALTDSGNVTFEGDGTSGFYLWGAQLEVGSFPTSYIPTEDTLVTRGADVVSITGTNFSSWYNQSEGTVFTASRHKDVTARNLAFTDGTANNALQQYLLASQAAMDSYVSGSWQGSGGASITFVADQQFKVASTIQENSGVTAADGVLGTLDDSYGIPTVDRLNIGQSRASDKTTGTISRLTYWDTRLSDTILQTITS